MDMGSRRILGHALGAHHDAALAYGALAMASPSGAVPYPGPAAIISPPGSGLPFDLGEHPDEWENSTSFPDHGGGALAVGDEGAAE